MSLPGLLAWCLMTSLYIQNHIAPIFFIDYFCLSQGKYSYKFEMSQIHVGSKEFPSLNFLRRKFSHSWYSKSIKIKSGEAWKRRNCGRSPFNIHFITEEELIFANRLGIRVKKKLFPCTQICILLRTFTYDRYNWV